MRLPHDAYVSVFRRGESGLEALLLRYAPDYGGYWHVVAGAVEPGESADQAALRELREETGLTAPLLGFRHGYAYSLPRAGSGSPEETESVSVSCFAVEAPPGWEPTLSREHDLHRWCSSGEAARLMHWDDAREALALAFAELGGGA
ncbi:MAG: NUDIX domain-containing protein [Gaiellaceae bacterium]